MVSRHFKITIFASSLCLTMSSCGSHLGTGRNTGKDSPLKHTNEASSDDETAIANDAVVPPKAYYDSLLAGRMLALDSGALNLKSQQILWVNFNGASVAKGYGRGQSFIVCKSQASIPSSNYSTTEQTQILQKVAQYYSNAGVNVSLTYERPQSGDFTTIHVGGKYSDLGCGSSASTLGIAPLDIDNANPNDVAFAFIPGANNIKIQALVIAHEAGHSFGLDHTDNHVDILYPSISSTQTGFHIGKTQGSQTQDGPLVLQKNLGSGVASISGTPVQPLTPVPTPTPISPTPSNPLFPKVPAGNQIFPGLPGISTLAGLSQILSQLSPSLISSLVPILPILGVLPGGTSLSDPLAILSALTLFQNGTSPLNGGGFDISNILGSLSGLPVNSLIPISLSNIGSSAQDRSQICDVADLMGLSNVSSRSALIAMIPQYAQLIQVNASGSQAQSLIDAVKIAIAQRYAGIGILEQLRPTSRP